MRRNYYNELNGVLNASGVDLNQDFHAQNIGDLMAELAKAHGYRKPHNANGSTGRYFFQRLQRDYRAFKASK